MTVKFFTYALLVLGLCFLVPACSTLPHSDKSETWTVNDFPDLKTLGLDRDASYLATYFQNINYPDAEDLIGDTPEARKKAQNSLRHSRALYFATRGINRTRLLKIAGTDEDVSAVLDRLMTGPIRFSDYLALSENVIMAKVGEPVPNATVLWSGPGAFFLSEEQPLNSIPPTGPIAVKNASSAHDIALNKGKECVFFLSPTLTKYQRAYPANIFPAEMPKDVIAQAFDPYCTNGDDIFTLRTQIGGDESLTRSEILKLSNPLKKTISRSTSLPPLNNAEVIGVWDIFEIDNYRAQKPLGRLSIFLQHISMELAGRDISNYGYIIDGKYHGQSRWISSYAGLTPAELTIWKAFEQSLASGTFFGNRQIINLRSDGFNFVAERSATKESKSNAVNKLLGNDKVLAVEQCLLDHPKVGPQNYAGLYVLGSARYARFMVIPGSESNFRDCTNNPDFQATTRTYSIGGDLSYEPKSISHSILDLTRASAAAHDLITQPGVKMSGGLRVTENEFQLTVEPKWADKNRNRLEKIMILYPALSVTEGVVDEIVLTGAKL